MTPGRHDPIVAAILAQLDIVNRTLGRMCVPASAHDDLRQVVTLDTWRAARKGRVAWQDALTLRAFLRVVAVRCARRWRRNNPPPVELREDHEAPVPSAEQVLVAQDMLRFLRESTTPERWRALVAQAKGIPAGDVARREHVPVGTIANRIRLARADLAAALAREDAAIYMRRR